MIDTNRIKGGINRCAWLLIGLTTMMSVSACSLLKRVPKVSVSAEAHWALLPISNFSDAPRADQQALTMIETELRSRGVSSLKTYTSDRSMSLRALLSDDSEYAKALNWARRSGFQYGMAGTINEWNYRSGTEQEPAVGINLKLIDLQANKVLWQANAARTGWGYASLPAVANDVIVQLLEEVQVRSAPDQAH